ncbi:MAG: signal peptidase I [Gemmatimonadota bacterium]
MSNHREEQVPATGRGERRPDAGGTAAAVGRWLWEWTKSILVAFLLFIVIRTFVVEAFRIPTGSMENTLLVGDFLLVNKAVYGGEIPGTDVTLPSFDVPHRGDVIVFFPPHEPDKNYVKRLIGVPGDTLWMRDQTLYRNGRAIREPYVRHSDPSGRQDMFVPSMLWQRRYLASGIDPGRYRPTRDNWGPIVVPRDRYFVLGDNRDDSEDSRYWGFVGKEAVKGQPLFVYYSFDPTSIRPFPWLSGIRWGRIGNSIR